MGPFFLGSVKGADAQKNPVSFLFIHPVRNLDVLLLTGASQLGWGWGADGQTGKGTDGWAGWGSSFPKATRPQARRLGVGVGKDAGFQPVSSVAYHPLISLFALDFGGVGTVYRTPSGN